ncbi:hypothetical protein BKA64DRAFT_699705 [Cadophora sp. MPI-SDFR-AT-0126]|nr:hypothetical protein BKA64DRAFT_699705 [Leotiomycetes sp. MPI-SDFR-AT-0126]
MAPSSGTKSKKKKTSAKKRKAVATAPGTSSALTNDEARVQAEASSDNVEAVSTRDMMEIDARTSAMSMNEDVAASNRVGNGEGEFRHDKYAFATQAQVLHKLDTEGRVVAIYDSVWTMEDVETIKVYPGYQGETVIFKAVRSGPSKSEKYKAVYIAGPYKAVYSCEKGTGFEIFHNFTLDFTNNAMVADFKADPLIFKFVDTMDKFLGVEHPYLYLEAHIDRANGKYFGSWAKRRYNNKEQIDLNRKIHLVEDDVINLSTRMEINMMHPSWSNYHIQTKALTRPWWNGWPAPNA